MLSILLLLLSLSPPQPPNVKYMDHQSTATVTQVNLMGEISLLYDQDWQHFGEKGLNKTKPTYLGWSHAVQTLPMAPCPWPGATSRLGLAFPIAQRLPL